MTREEVLDYIETEFGVQADQPFADDDTSCVVRRKDNGKWFGILMQIPLSRLKPSAEGSADILNIKCDPVMLGSLLALPGFYRAWHMNKLHWITLVLAEIEDPALVFSLIGFSYHATASLRKKKRHTETVG